MSGESSSAVQRVVALALLWSLPPADAGQLSRLDVDRSGRRFQVKADLVVDAPMAFVRERLTDYGNLDSLDPSIRLSEVLPSLPGFDARVRTVIETCVPFYCRELVRVENVREMDARLLMVIDPEQSDFRYGRAEWVLRSSGKRVGLSYEAELEPDFALPPVLGGAIIKRGLRREFERLITNIERLATTK